VVTGCGGGSSSAPGTTGSSTAAAPASTKPSAGTGNSGDTAATGGRKAQKQAGEGQAQEAEKPSKSQGESGKDEKKHPPLELPKGPPEPKITKAEKERAPAAELEVILPGGLTAANTCEGKNLSPVITWGKIPSGTAELAIFAVNTKPVNGALHYDWALAGVDPSLTGLKAGEVPKGAVLGRNGSGQIGYSLCPKGSEPETYIFSVYAVSKRLSPKQGFEALAFRKQASRGSEQVGLAAATLSG